LMCCLKYESEMYEGRIKEEVVNGKDSPGAEIDHS